MVGHTDHRNAPYVFGDVEIGTVPGTLAAGVFGATPTVRCSRLESVAALGRGLVTTAATTDGVIEAVAFPRHASVLAVQWHPEEGMDRRPSMHSSRRPGPTPGTGTTHRGRSPQRLTT